MANIMTAERHFDLLMTAELALAAEEVYHSPDNAERLAAEHWNCHEFRFIDVDATQCFVAANYEQIFVCFRGTESCVDDWIVDLDFSLVPGPWGTQVHEGFYNALSCVWQLLDQEVQRLQNDRPRPLLVTGHSLGGALANLAVARWCELGRPVEALYTFGQPRVGDQLFSRQFDFAFRARTFRMVNHLDIVTRTPPRSLGYSHNGTLIYLTKDGRLDHDRNWWERFLNGWCGAIDSILDWCGEGIEDHRMTSYLQLLDQLVQAAPDQALHAPATSSLALASARRPHLAPLRRAA